MTPERALLVDIDNSTKRKSEYPNLALMKIASRVKADGGIASFNVFDPTNIYISVVFDYNLNLAKSSAKFLSLTYPNATIDLGGSGYDISKTLDDRTEKQTPDYTLYPDIDYSLGFTSRGCVRNCEFCIVRKKEGSFRIAQHPSEFHNPEFRKIVLMDNNILANKDWFFDITDWILENRLKVDFNQGLDIRLMNPEIADRLAKLHPISVWRFAYDSTDYSKAVYHGIQTLADNGVSVRNDCHFYVYLSGDNCFDDALRRCKELKNWGTTPYLMVDTHAERTQRIRNLARWCRPWIFWSIDYENYKAEL